MEKRSDLPSSHSEFMADLRMKHIFFNSQARILSNCLRGVAALGWGIVRKDELDRVRSWACGLRFLFF